MWHVGVDLHRKTVVIAAVHDSGEVRPPIRLQNSETERIRWLLIEVAMKLVQQDVALANFYQRIRKRSSAKIARVAAARKLGEICWKRLLGWEREHHPEAAVA